MYSYFKKYAFEPYRFFLLIVLAALSYAVVEIKNFYSRNCMTQITGIAAESQCTDFFRTYIHSPLTTVYTDLLLLFLILNLLPNHYLRDWFIYLGSWTVPLAVLFVYTTQPYSDALIAWIGSPADAAAVAVYGITILTIAYIFLRLGWQL